MPELPEVEMARICVQNSMLGSKVLGVEVLDPRMLQDIPPDALGRRLRDKEVLGTGRHGKNLLIVFEDGSMHIHLGMSGSISFSDRLDRHTPHERLRLTTDHGVMLLDDPRRFGSFGWVRDREHLISEKGLGPDALTVREEDFVPRMEGRRGALKPALLDQGIVAGLGNLYVDEVLFQERLHPRTKIAGLTRKELEYLCARIRKVLEASISVRTEFSQLPDHFLLRDRRKGTSCPRCGTALESIRLGGRTAVLCPACQPIGPERRS